MLDDYAADAEERIKFGLPPLPLSKDQTRRATALLETGHEHAELLLSLLLNRVEPGVSDAALVKAQWLKKVALGDIVIANFDGHAAISALTSMGGGFNVPELIEFLSNEDLAPMAADGLKQLIKVYGGINDIAKLAAKNTHAENVLESWAEGEWFRRLPEVPECLEFALYKVEGEINTDDFSPGNQAQSRPDIPLHATFLGIKRFPGGIEAMAEMRRRGLRVAFAGDVVGTGSSRKSAVNSLLWHIGDDIPHTPNKRRGGIVVGSTIAPIFHATARDAGILPIEGDVASLQTGEVLKLYPYRWILTDSSGDELPIKRPPSALVDEYRAGGRLNLIIGRKLSQKACELMGRELPPFFQVHQQAPATQPAGYTLAQKMIGRATGVEGVLPGSCCEPKISTVGSQDTTGPMTMQELDELACRRFETDLFMQSFCHTAAYPKEIDVSRWHSMTGAVLKRGGVVLKPGDGVIHPWLNTMLLPDTVGTGGDSHTRFPLGISFPAGSGLVAFAGALGFMPLEMPESVLVRFKGKRNRGITVRDMVNAIPYEALKQGLLTVDKKNKKNVFAGRILEIVGIDDLSVEEGFELSDASAERSAAACTLQFHPDAVETQTRTNISRLKGLVEAGYGEAQALRRRIFALDQWLAAPSLLLADTHAEYAHILEIDLQTISEPLLACPNDPDDVRPLSEVAGEKVDEAFVGSCMIHRGHLEKAAQLLEKGDYCVSRLWIAPPTREDRYAVLQQGVLSIFGQSGARVEIPGCSLCMGNQARVRPRTTVVSTSTRNFDNRLGDNTRIYLGSTPLTVISAQLGYIPSVKEYFDMMTQCFDDVVNDMNTITTTR